METEDFEYSDEENRRPKTSREKQRRIHLPTKAGPELPLLPDQRRNVKRLVGEILAP